MALKILSMNCQGLGDLDTRRDVFNYLRKMDCSIFCLQDTHFENAQKAYIRAQWGYECLTNSFNSSSRGVAILFKSNFEYKLGRTKCDDNGNLLVIEIETSFYRITIVNIYGPNKDTPDFYKMVSESLEEFDNEFNIVCGDFNLVLDQELDTYNYKHRNNPQARNEILKIMNKFNLCDPWRINNPDSRRYTWSKKAPLKKARLDFFLISEELLSCILKTSIVPGYKTDHNAIEISIQLSEFTKGKGFWKFNNSLLNNTQYVERVKSVIYTVVEEYALLPYDRNYLLSADPHLISLMIGDHLFFEILLTKIRGMSICFSAALKKEKELKRKQLENRINFLTELVDKNPESKIFVEWLEEKKKQEELDRREYMKGLILRSRARWIEDGEKPSKYFLNLEKRNYVNKTITQLVCENSNIITEQNQILEEARSYYSKLYMSQEEYLIDIDLDELFRNTKIPKVENTSEYVGQIKASEALCVLKNMKNNKTPGPDGFTVEFFKFFWQDIGKYLLRSINYSFEIGELSITQKQGIITLLPKGNKPRDVLKNWRPISLLNTTYKIISGCIANRIKQSIDKLIHENQKGFLAGRCIAENTRLLYDLMHYTSENNIPALLLLVDFEKAFDSVSWGFINKTLKLFNYGEDIIKWVNILNKNCMLTVIQNGFFTSPKHRINFEHVQNF